MGLENAPLSLVSTLYYMGVVTPNKQSVYWLKDFRMGQNLGYGRDIGMPLEKNGRGFLDGYRA